MRPALSPTEMWEQVDQDPDGDRCGGTARSGNGKSFSAEILKGRVAQPEDITGDNDVSGIGRDSDYMTGQIIMIDGGA